MHRKHHFKRAMLLNTIPSIHQFLYLILRQPCRLYDLIQLYSQLQQVFSYFQLAFFHALVLLYAEPLDVKILTAELPLCISYRNNHDKTLVLKTYNLKYSRFVSKRDNVVAFRLNRSTHKALKIGRCYAIYSHLQAG